MAMHVYHDDCDWFVAADFEDLRKVKSEYLTGKPDEPWDPHGDMGEPDDFEMLPDDKVISVLDEDGPKPGKHTKTAAEWVAANGRGFLCSTEF